MNDFLNKLERKWGRHAIRHLTAVMIALMVAGYAISAASPTTEEYLSLNIYQILHGQIWRIITWILIPPSTLSIWTIIMLMFYLSIGMSLERAWGDFRYNCYIIGGLIISIAAAFLTYFIYLIFFPGMGAYIGSATGSFFSTYYICMSILLAYAATFPNAVVLVMFVLPVKMKYFGWIYGAFMAYDAITYIRYAVSSGNSLYFIAVIAMAASLVNFLIFFLSSRNRVHLTREQKARQRAFRNSMNQAQRGGFGGQNTRNSGFGGRYGSQGPQNYGQNGNYGNQNPQNNSYRGGYTPPPAQNQSRGQYDNIQDIRPRHRCEICGRTDITNPDLEFRYCSKCAGAHEYCMDHLYNHRHILVDPEQNRT